MFSSSNSISLASPSLPNPWGPGRSGSAIAQRIGHGRATAAGLQTLVLALALVPMCPLNRIGRALAPLGSLAPTAAMLQTIGDRVHAAASSSSGQLIRSRFLADLQL